MRSLANILVLGLVLLILCVHAGVLQVTQRILDVPREIVVDDARLHTTETVTDCSDEEDLLEIEYIKLNPDPPLKGRQLHIEAAGYLKDRVDEGSWAQLEVKYGIIRLVNQRRDLCEEARNVDKNCPFEKGRHTLNHTAELPKTIPPGRYYVYVQVFTPDDRRISCLKATAAFSLF